MTTRKHKTDLSVMEAVTGNRDLMKALIKEALQEVLGGEMTEFLGAAPGERTEDRNGYRSGYYGRNLVTRIGKQECACRATGRVSRWFCRDGFGGEPPLVIDTNAMFGRFVQFTDSAKGLSSFRVKLRWDLCPGHHIRQTIPSPTIPDHMPVRRHIEVRAGLTGSSPPDPRMMSAR